MVNSVRQQVVWLDEGARDAIEHLFQTAKAEAQRNGGPVFLSIAAWARLPHNWIYEAMQSADVDDVRVFWAAGEEPPHVGLGTACTVTASGGRRFRDIIEQMKKVTVLCDERASLRVRWFGGFSFTEDSCAGVWRAWPQAMFFLPKYQFVCESGNEVTRLIATVNVWFVETVDELIATVEKDVQSYLRRVRPSNVVVPHLMERSTGTMDDVPTVRQTSADASVQRDDWCKQVDRTAKDIREGRFEKVVLARPATFVTPNHAVIDIRHSLSTLRANYPHSFVFGITWKGQCFLGASPERLAAAQNGLVSIDCLAGTAPRGENPEEDARLGEELLKSEKNRREHAVVVRWIRETVDEFVVDVKLPPEPALKRLKNVQHLHTPLEAMLKPGATFLDLVERLHPTPAVAGVPQADALQVIRDREGFSRGWYAAPIGWLDLNGGGEFAVALRCALIQGEVAHLFAGAGIMGDSDPEAEWHETEMKMQPMKLALGLI
jgi:isochorismate synthase